MKAETTFTAELEYQDNALLGEGPVWDWRSQRLFWVDIEGFAVHIWSPALREHGVIHTGQYVGSLAVRKSGGLIVALKSGFAALDPETGEITPVADAESYLPGNRFNDGKCDPAGRFWAGTMALDEKNGKGKGTLYCLDADLTVQRKVPGVTISNGLAWTSDERTMYYIDSPTQKVIAYDYDKATGDISNPRTAVDVPAKEMGYPDGMTIDGEGMLWVAHWDGGRVCRWNPQTGEELAEIKVPASRPTSCVFGGENFDTLYITSARTRLGEEKLAAQPLAGSVFKCRPGVRGLPMNEFAG
ncbi:MAG TPA: SMP-30/gluconolactonase/LRE family protein [Blastocatellia bacterium]|nr:SMP-30/gluconolactonase/LRE family protein [Blastocatellia bacterium]